MKWAMTLAMADTLGFAAPPARRDGGAVAEGADLCKAQGARCHGRAGKGSGRFPRPAGRTADVVSRRLTAFRAGEKVGPNSSLMMPVARDLSDDQNAAPGPFVSDRSSQGLFGPAGSGSRKRRVNAGSFAATLFWPKGRGRRRAGLTREEEAPRHNLS